MLTTNINRVITFSFFFFFLSSSLSLSLYLWFPLTCSLYLYWPNEKKKPLEFCLSRHLHSLDKIKKSDAFPLFRFIWNAFSIYSSIVLILCSFSVKICFQLSVVSGCLSFVQWSVVVVVVLCGCWLFHLIPFLVILFLAACNFCVFFLLSFLCVFYFIICY